LCHAFDEDYGSAFALREHHFVDRKGGDARDFGHVADGGEDVSVISELAAVLQDQDVCVDAQHLVAEGLFKAGRDRQDGQQGCHPEGDADDRDQGDHRDGGALLGAQVADADLEAVAHAPTPYHARYQTAIRHALGRSPVDDAKRRLCGGNLPD
jgi:hypothetical protein